MRNEINIEHYKLGFKVGSAAATPTSHAKMPERKDIISSDWMKGYMAGGILAGPNRNDASSDMVRQMHERALNGLNS